nr:sugar transporter ERD6-like 5 [Tanacetum cinerariifolium]
MMDDLGLSLEEYSVFGSILTIGAMVGAVMSGKIADRLGRRGTMGLSQMFCLLGWLTILYSEVSWLLDAGRLLIGYGIGVISYVVPVYIAEITPKNLRGAFTYVNQLMIAMGISVMWLVGIVIPWRTLAFIGAIPCLLQMVGLFFIPESPRWLAKKGRWKDSEFAIQRLRGENAEISEEVAEIRDYTENLHQLSESRVSDLLRPEYAKSLIIGVGLMVLQQFGGVNAIAFYANSIFISAGFSSSIGSIALVIVQIPFTMLGVLLMDVSGRRPLLMVSAAGTCVGCLFLGISFLLQDLHVHKGLSPILALVGVLVFKGSFSLGMGGIPWVIMSEIFPMNIKSLAGSLVTVVNWFGSWVVSYSFNFLMKFSTEGTFFVFSSICCITVLFVANDMEEDAPSSLNTLLITTSSSRATGVVVFSTLVAVSGSYVFGSAVGFSSPAQIGIMQDLSLSLEEYSVFGSIMTIGAMVGAIMSGKIADKLGRRKTMGLSEMFCLLGWLAILFSKVSWLLDAGRLSIGYGIGVLSYVVPVYIAEITPQNLRGAFTTVNQLMICIGVSVMWLIGTFIPWRTLALIGTIPCLLQVVGLFFIPESPRWLANIGMWKDCESALHRLRGENADISEEATEIKDYTETLHQLPETRICDMFQPEYTKSLSIGVGLMVLQQFGGVNAIAYYANSIFVSAGFSSTIGSIAMVIVQVPATLLGVLLMDVSGRRPLLMISAAGTCLGCFLTGISFLLQDLQETNGLNSILALVGVLVFSGSFSLGMGGIPWVIMSEGSAGSLVTVVNWFGSWVVSYTFNFLMTWSTQGTFFTFASICFLTVLFVAKVVPETKGRTLEDIQASMNPLTMH